MSETLERMGTTLMSDRDMGHPQGHPGWGGGSPTVLGKDKTIPGVRKGRREGSRGVI